MAMATATEMEMAMEMAMAMATATETEMEMEMATGADVEEEHHQVVLCSSQRTNLIHPSTGERSHTWGFSANPQAAEDNKTVHFQISDDEVSVFKSIFPYQYYLPKKYVVLIRNSSKFVLGQGV